MRLVPHPEAPRGAVRAIAATWSRTREGLRVGYRLEGDLSGLRVPAPGRSRMGANLWQHTCFEMFIARSGQPAYHEFNLSPSGEWAAHAFSGYRSGGPLADARLEPQLKVNRATDVLELEAIVALDTLGYGEARLDVGLSAVVEAQDGTLSYWSLRHRAGKPDFHHRDGFALQIDAIRN